MFQYETPAVSTALASSSGHVISNGSIIYTDAVAKTLPSRYYRAKIQ